MSIEDSLFEVRSRISSGRIARVLFFTQNDELFLLHGFIKKTQKTTRHELGLAKRRKREMEEL